MSDPYNLTELDKAVLRALAEANDFSLSAHSAEGFIMKKLSPTLRGRDAKKSLHKLHKMRFCYKQPTGGDTTYYITRDGLRIAQAV